MAVSSGFGPFIYLMQLIPFLLVIGLIAIIGLILARGDSQTNPVVRVIWFFLIGWWLGLIWFTLSIALMATIIFLPIGAYTATKTWKVMTLSGSKGPKDAASEISVDVENKIKQETETTSSSGKENVEKDNEKDEAHEKLQKLKDMKEDGLITEEEFKEKKEEIMDEI